MLYYVTCAMLRTYVISDMLYNICYVIQGMLYNIRYVLQHMLYDITTSVMLYNMCYGMLYNICYVI